MQMYVLMTPSTSIAYNHNLIEKLISLQNINLIKVNIDVLVHGSPMFKWYRQKKWRKSKWKVNIYSFFKQYCLYNHWVLIIFNNILILSVIPKSVYDSNYPAEGTPLAVLRP